MSITTSNSTRVKPDLIERRRRMVSPRPLPALWVEFEVASIRGIGGHVGRQRPRGFPSAGRGRLLWASASSTEPLGAILLTITRCGPAVGPFSRSKRYSPSIRLAVAAGPASPSLGKKVIEPLTFSPSARETEPWMGSRAGPPFPQPTIRPPRARRLPTGNPSLFFCWWFVQFEFTNWRIAGAMPHACVGMWSTENAATCPRKRGAWHPRPCIKSIWTDH